jgi:hypothetical protein
MNFRPGHVDLAINVPLLSSLAIRTIALGLGFGDRFGGFQGRSGPLEEMVPHAKKAGELQGKRPTKRLLGIA